MKIQKTTSLEISIRTKQITYFQKEKMTRETPEVHSDKRKPGEKKEITREKRREKTREKEREKRERKRERTERRRVKIDSIREREERKRER